MLALDDGDNHLEIEIVKKGCAEVFFLRRDTDDTWKTEFNVDEIDLSLPDLLLDELSFYSKLKRY